MEALITLLFIFGSVYLGWKEEERRRPTATDEFRVPDNSEVVDDIVLYDMIQDDDNEAYTIL